MKSFFKRLSLFASLSLILCIWNPLHASAEIEQVSLIGRPYPTASKVTDTTTLTKYNLLQGKQAQPYTGYTSWSLATLNQYGDILYNNNRIDTTRFSDMSFYQSLNGSVSNLLTQRAFEVVKGHQYQVSYQLKNSSYGTAVPQFKMSIRQGSGFDGEIIKQLSVPLDSMTYQNFKTVDFSGSVSFQTRLYSEQVFVVMSGSNLSIIDLDQNIIEARRDVEQLFTDTSYTKLNEFVTQKELDNVKKTVDLVVNSTERAFLLQYTNLAQEFLDAIQMSLITTELGDNRENLNSMMIKGTTYPHAYVRVTGNSNLPATSLVSPFKDEPENFTLQADENGDYTVNLENAGHFIAGEKVVVVANRHGKRLSETVTVKDQTIPTGKAKTVHSILKDAIPIPDKFVSDLNDSNPTNKKITVEYSMKNNSEKITEMLQKSGKYLVYVTIKDDAFNSTEIQSELIVYDSNSLLESTNFQIDQEELISLSNA
ncbi:toxin Cry1Ac domain D-VI-related protein [Carnobacterium maltaromaticum]|nr:toxin Cry1Ac domain D-VI-related protein [Carnobacterium maltaromaticum]